MNVNNNQPPQTGQYHNSQDREAPKQRLTKGGGSMTSRRPEKISDLFRPEESNEAQTAETPQTQNNIRADELKEKIALADIQVNNTKAKKQEFKDFTDLMSMLIRKTDRSQRQFKQNFWKRFDDYFINAAQGITGPSSLRAAIDNFQNIVDAMVENKSYGYNYAGHFIKLVKNLVDKKAPNSASLLALYLSLEYARHSSNQMLELAERAQRRGVLVDALNYARTTAKKHKLEIPSIRTLNKDITVLLEREYPESIKTSNKKEKNNSGANNNTTKKASTQREKIAEAIKIVESKDTCKNNFTQLVSTMSSLAENGINRQNRAFTKTFWSKFYAYLKLCASEMNSSNMTYIRAGFIKIASHMMLQNTGYAETKHIAKQIKNLIDAKASNSDLLLNLLLNIEFERYHPDITVSGSSKSDRRRHIGILLDYVEKTVKDRSLEVEGLDKFKETFQKLVKNEFAAKKKINLK